MRHKLADIALPVAAWLIVVWVVCAVAGCTAQEAEAWSPVLREIIVAGVAVVGLNLHRNRTRRKALEQLRGK